MAATKRSTTAATTDHVLRDESLESHVRRKLSRVVRRGGVGEVPRIGRDNSLAPYPTACPVRRGLVGVILARAARFVFEWRRVAGFVPQWHNETQSNPDVLPDGCGGGATRNNPEEAFFLWAVVDQSGCKSRPGGSGQGAARQGWFVQPRPAWGVLSRVTGQIGRDSSGDRWQIQRPRRAQP